MGSSQLSANVEQPCIYNIVYILVHVRRVTNPPKQKILNKRTRGNVISKRNLTNKLKMFK